MSTKLDEVFIEINPKDDKLNQSFKNIKKDFKGIQSETKKTASIFNSAFAKMAAGAFAFKKAFDFAIEAKNAARDAEETQNKFDTVFESIRDEARETSRVLAKSFGLASSSANKLLSDTGDILVGFGFTEKAALELSNKVNTLAVDLASFTNFQGGAERASQALTKAILGETESAKALGIVLRQGTKEFKQQVEEIKRTQGVTENAARAIVLLNEAYKQSGKAIGDFARTQNSLANQERILNEQLKETKEILGSELQSSFLTIIKFLGDFNREIQSSNEGLSVFGGIGKVITSILVVVGRVLKGVGTQIGGIGAALAQLFSGNFTESFEAIKITFNRQIDNFVGIKDDLVGIWSDLDSDIAKKINTGNTGATKKAIKGLTETTGETGSIEDINKQLDILTGKIEKTANPVLLKTLIQESVFLESKLKSIQNLIEKTTKEFSPTAGLGEEPTDEGFISDIDVDDTLKEINSLEDLINNVGKSAEFATNSLTNGFARAIVKASSLNDVLSNTLALFGQLLIQSTLTSLVDGLGIGSFISGLFGSSAPTTALPQATANVGLGQDIRGLQGTLRALNGNLGSLNNQPLVLTVNADGQTLVKKVIDPNQEALSNGGFQSDPTT